MNHFIVIALIAMVGLLILEAMPSASAATRISPKSRQNDILSGIKQGDVIPFSFQIGEKPAEFEKVSVEEATIPSSDLLQANWRRLDVRYKVKGRPLSVKLSCTAPPDYSLTTIAISLTRTGDLTEHIHDIKILDINITHKDNAEIHGITGSGHEIEWPPLSFKPWNTKIEPGKPVVVDSDRTGRSSNQYVPIFILHCGKEGIWFGPEWSGCWDLSISKAGEAIKLAIGMPTFDFTTREDETIDLPAATIGSYSGSVEDGYNRIRHIVHQHYLPKVSGKKPQPLVYFQGYFGHPTYQDEKTMYREVDRAALVGCEAFVLDGGWNNVPENTDWWHSVGNWDDPGRFTSGVKKFGDYVKSKGMRFGIWLEPRASEGSAIYRQHPNVCPESLFDLANPEGERLFTDVMNHLIETYGADLLWLDYNIDARPAVWDKNEQPDRKGLMELGFYQGWYRAIEAVMKKHPDVWIESCASGGRIIDLAQLRRSHSIWVNDNPIYANAGIDKDDWYNRNIRSGLNLILPAVYIQNSIFLDSNVWQNPPEPGARLNGSHRLLTYFSGDLGYGQGLCFWDPQDIREAAKYSAAYKEYRHYLEKDYYHLLPLPDSLDAWDGWQYHDVKTNSGIVIVFRLCESKDASQTIPIKAINKAKDYSWTIVSGEGAVESYTSNALKVRLEKAGAVLLHYKKK